MIAVIYARYSSSNQKEESIAQQIAVCRRYAEENDITIAAEYADYAISGTDAEHRPQFQKMIADSEAKKWRYVLVYKVDRFARNRKDSAVYKYILSRNGVKVVSVMEPIPEGPEGILLETLLEGSAEYYSANLRQNVLRGMEGNAMECKINSLLPLGYKSSKDNRYEIDEETAHIVREIFDKYESGTSCADIIRSLNQRGLRTNQGRKFSMSTIQSIIRNERYIGVYVWRDIRVEDGIPAIISKEQFENVKKRIKSIKRAPASRNWENFLLTGKLYCGHCGSNMTGTSGTSRDGSTHYYYQCHGKKSRKTGCHKKNVKKDFIENLVVKTLYDKCLNRDAIQKIVDAAMLLQEQEKDRSMLATLKKDHADVKKGIDNFLALIEKGLFTESMATRLQALEQRNKELEAAIAAECVIQPEITREELFIYLSNWANEDIKTDKFKEKFIDCFVSKVVLYDDKLEIYCDFPGSIRKNTENNFIEVSLDSGSSVFDFSEEWCTIFVSSEHLKLTFQLG